MFTAKHYVRIAGKLYEPGKEIPADAMSDAAWKRLYARKAITGTPDPVEAVLENEGGDDDIAPPPVEEKPEGTENTDKPEEPKQQEEPEEPMQQEEPGKARKPRGADKKKAGKAEEEPELPMIDAGAMVVD